jgi:uncharacterized RDD family membrane protein YckC
VPDVVTPGFIRRILCMIYEALLLFAVLFVAAFLFVYLTKYPQRPDLRPVLQIFLLGVTAGYFTWFWYKSGQTLAMKTWRIKLVNHDGQLLTFPNALLRFALALVGLLLAGVSIWWALFDHEGQFLHDRLLNSRLVTTANIL